MSNILLQFHISVHSFVHGNTSIFVPYGCVNCCIWSSDFFSSSYLLFAFFISRLIVSTFSFVASCREFGPYDL